MSSLGINLQLEVTGEIEIQARFRDIAPIFIEESLRAVNQVNSDCVRYIVDGELAGVMLNRQTGNLADSIAAIPAVALAEAGMITGGVEQRDQQAPYGKWHEYGAEIPAMSGNPILAWTGEDGNPVFARRTRAHRLPPTPFMQRAASIFDSEYRSAVLQSIERSMSKVGF